MKLIDFVSQLNLSQKSELEKVKHLCFYQYKETNTVTFSMSLICELMISSGFNQPNTSRLKDKLTKGKDKCFLITKGSSPNIEFIPISLQKLELDIGNLWNDNETIDTNSELIEESKFCGKRNYLDRLIYQTNNCYANNCYDAVAVLMRRLFEVLLILSYQNLNIDDEIKSGDGYLMLDGIVKNALNNQTLKLSRIKKDFDSIRKVGNFSAHNITYTAGKKDIDDIKLSYRVMLEELYHKSGLI